LDLNLAKLSPHSDGRFQNFKGWEILQFRLASIEMVNSQLLVLCSVHFARYNFFVFFEIVWFAFFWSNQTPLSLVEVWKFAQKSVWFGLWFDAYKNDFHQNTVIVVHCFSGASFSGERIKMALVERENRKSQLAERERAPVLGIYSRQLHFRDRSCSGFIKEQG